MIMDNLLKELIKKQLKKVPKEYKLTKKDIVRIRKGINTSIFNKNKCCIWQKYITFENDEKRKPHINFYFRTKRVLLKRILYMNYVGELKENEYIKYKCKNIGKCCNINHIKKIKYKKFDPRSKKEKNNSPKKQKKIPLETNIEYNIILDINN